MQAVGPPRLRPPRNVGLLTVRLNPLKVCLAGSGGGHLRQLLDLEPVWSKHDYFFLTEDTALGRSVAQSHPSHFVTHVALGQARLGNPVHMLRAAVKNSIQSAEIILRERPDVLISTGAGAMYFSLLWARLVGCKVIVIDSFARFDHPSAFAKMAARLAHSVVVQSAALRKDLPQAEVFDPLEILHTPAPDKEPLLFATVGATLPFKRLVSMIVELKARGEIPERVILQTGVGGPQPDGIDTVETLSFDEIQSILKRADFVVCHGGTGSLITALREGCRVVAVPRLFELGEHYDNHQEEISRAFAQRGLVEVARSTEDFSVALRALRVRAPVLATTNPRELIKHLEGLLASWS